MKPFAAGATGAIAVIAVFSFGVFCGNDLGSRDGELRAQFKVAPKESAQMQCLHWLDNKQFSSANNPNVAAGTSFGMYTALCGQPGNKE